MNKKIYATLDFNKSLRDFKDNVTKLLELTEIENWDGVKIKEKEEEIRNNALVLAGQCVAVLLYKISQSNLSIDIANKKTQRWWRAKTKNHGYKKRQILTVGNVEVTLNIPYVVTRSYEKKQSKKYFNQGFHPILRWLSMEEGVTPLVWSTIAKCGAISASFEAARHTLIDWGVNPPFKTYRKTNL